MSTKPEEGANFEDMDSEEARHIIDLQFQAISNLNDGLERTIRTHVILGGGVVTGVAFIVSNFGVQIFFVDEPGNILQLIQWGIGAALTALFFARWIRSLSAEHISYSIFKMGVHPSMDVRDGRMDRRKAKEQHAQEREGMNAIQELYAVVKFLFLDFKPETREDITSERYGYPEPSERSASTVSNNYSDLVRYNDLLLFHRELYIDRARNRLHSFFLFYILGLGMTIVV